jgi:putative ABC transport system ATP-binding protein
MESILNCEEIRHEFGTAPHVQTVLAGVNLRFHPGESCALVGPSGSGKTTLLTIFGCLLSPTSGVLRIQGQIVAPDDQQRLVQLRGQCMGFVFQHSQLLPFLTVADNLKVVGRNAGLQRTQVQQRIDHLLKVLEIEHLRNKMPDQASGGERQRVAIARAVLHEPPIVLADEPTAALDWHSGLNVVKLLTKQARDQGALLITVTHDTRLLEWFDRVLTIDAGQVFEDSK